MRPFFVSSLTFLLALFSPQLPLASSADYPVHFDLRIELGDAPPVKNQKACGSCWILSSVSNVEWLLLKKGNKLELGTQPLVDCLSGCAGGDPSDALDYLRDSGTAFEADYPYKGYEGTCMPYTSIVEIDSWHRMYNTTNDLIKLFMYQNKHPVTTTMYVYGDFYSYSGGIYKHTTGSYLGSKAVLIIGWGSEGGIDYWICQNTWGPTWGDNGYFRIQLNDSNITQYNWVVDSLKSFAPVANAGEDQMVFDQIVLDATKSSDQDGSIESYEWLLNYRGNAAYNRTAQSDEPTVTVSDLVPGFYDVVLTVTDNDGLKDTDEMLFSAIGIKGDFDGDGDVDGDDLSIFSNYFGTIPLNP